jgi:hypothetical protein
MAALRHAVNSMATAFGRPTPDWSDVSPDPIALVPIDRPEPVNQLEILNRAMIASGLVKAPERFDLDTDGLDNLLRELLATQTDGPPPALSALGDQSGPPAPVMLENRNETYATSGFGQIHARNSIGRVGRDRGRATPTPATSSVISLPQAMNVLNALAYASTTELPLNTFAVVTFTGSDLLPAGSPPTARQTSACQARVIAVYGDYAKACGFPPTHLWVLERVSGKGLHLNLLAHLPREDHEAHRLALQRSLEACFGHVDTDDHRAVYVEPDYLAPSSAFIRTHYAMKGIDPSVETYARIGRDAGPTREGTIFGKRLGTSKNIAPGARRQAGYADTATLADLNASRWLRRHIESVIIPRLRQIVFSHMRSTYKSAATILVQSQANYLPPHESDITSSMSVLRSDSSEDHHRHARPACGPHRGILDPWAARPGHRRRSDAGTPCPRPDRDRTDWRRRAAHPTGMSPRPPARATGPPPQDDPVKADFRPARGAAFPGAREVPLRLSAAHEGPPGSR